MTGLRRVAGKAQESVLNIVAVLGALAILAATLCFAFDLRVLAFQSGSMSPTISTGSLAVARSVPAADLRVDDVVSVPTKTGSRVTHRIVGIEQVEGRAVLRLQGDGNDVPDAASYPVRQADRVLFSVPWLGYLGMALTSPVGLVALGLLMAALVAVLIRETVRRRPQGARSRGAVIAVVALGVAAPPVLAGHVDGTLAAFTDQLTSTRPTLDAGTIPVPTLSCGATGTYSVRVTWTAVPGATSYTVRNGVNGGETLTVPGTVTEARFTSIVTGVAWVVANRAFAGTTWSSVPSATRSYKVGLSSTCT